MKLPIEEFLTQEKPPLSATKALYVYELTKSEDGKAFRLIWQAILGFQDILEFSILGEDTKAMQTESSTVIRASNGLTDEDERVYSLFALSAQPVAWPQARHAPLVFTNSSVFFLDFIGFDMTRGLAAGSVCRSRYMTSYHHYES